MRYWEFMNNITPYELFEGLLAYGMFSDRLPPFLSSKQYYGYTKTNQPPSPKPQKYVLFESTRSVYATRQLGIPTPLTYYMLCKTLEQHWTELQSYFANATSNQTHKISRIHLRKMKDSVRLYEMNYSNWKVGDNPQTDLLLGKKWLVRTDISQFYPSIYTHAISWALVGKNEAKEKKGREHRNLWFNEIDAASQSTTYGETHGVLIGPDASSLLAEIILCAVDNKLADKWSYTRAIDDYECFVESYEDGVEFLTSLREGLREFGLLLNPKKTEIIELPKFLDKEWVHEIKRVLMLTDTEIVNYKQVKACLDEANHLAEMHHDAAVYTFALSALKKRKLTENAKEYLIKMYLHWAVIFPYLLPAISKHLFATFSIEQHLATDFVNCLYSQCMKNSNNEGISFSFFFAIKHDVSIEEVDCSDLISKGTAISLLLAYLYFKKERDAAGVNLLVNHAKTLKDEDFDENWIFAYEVLEEADFEACYTDAVEWRGVIDEWKRMKNNGVSFVSL